MLDTRGQGESPPATITFGVRERLDIAAAVNFVRSFPTPIRPAWASSAMAWPAMRHCRRRRRTLPSARWSPMRCGPHFPTILQTICKIPGYPQAGSFPPMKPRSS